MKKHLAVLAGIGLIAATAIAVPGLAGDNNRGSVTVACGDNGTITASPTVLWPPNHKDVPITFTYTDADPEEAVEGQSLTITQNLHDEVVDGEELVGSGNTPFLTDSAGGTNSDTDGSVDVVGSARSERSGTGDGRTYEFDYSADDGGMTDGCASDPMTAGDGIIVSVPHDCRAVAGGNSPCNDGNGN
jgi:hypothetical protein